MSITLLTWNTARREEALPVLERYVQRLVRRGSDYVIALQESFDDALTLKTRVGGEAIGNGSLVLLSSTALVEPVVSHERFVSGVAKLSGGDVALFNYHGRSRAEPGLEAVARGGYASEYRWVFDEIAGSRRRIVLGDFNASPRLPKERFRRARGVRHAFCFRNRP